MNLLRLTDMPLATAPLTQGLSVATNGIPRSSANPGRRADDAMAGFLACGSQPVRFGLPKAFGPQWSMKRWLAAYSCGYSAGIGFNSLTGFPFTPPREGHHLTGCLRQSRQDCKPSITISKSVKDKVQRAKSPFAELPGEAIILP